MAASTVNKVISESSWPCSAASAAGPVTSTAIDSKTTSSLFNPRTVKLRDTSSLPQASRYGIMSKKHSIMPAAAPTTQSRILREYADKTPGSARLYERARRLFPNGVTHVGRYLQPHPIYVSRTAGSHKWDVDGNDYVDYFGGHGALLLGHNHPAVMEAVREQLARGSHYGASHELEVEWAELIQEMVPCAERLRFVNSGTEATLLVLRLARAYTGKPMVVRFGGHFHGWHDQVAFSADASPGIPKAVADQVLVLPPNDMARFCDLCDERNDIAAVILEPTGATFGHIPLPRQFLADLRAITAQRGIVLIFDEVVTGFRCSPGGAQGLDGITPDLAPLAKIVAGGYPGAALAGQADILRFLEYRNDGEQLKLPAIPHQGTFNGAPVSAAAGIATLRLVRESDVIARANRTAAAIRDGMNDAIRRVGASWC